MKSCGGAESLLSCLCCLCVFGKMRLNGAGNFVRMSFWNILISCVKCWCIEVRRCLLVVVVWVCVYIYMWVLLALVYGIQCV
jgi:hypothetical protein